MKLYTEEQLKKAMLEYTSNSKPTMVQVIDTLKPIELPSNRNIGDESIERYKHMEHQYKYIAIYGFNAGAKWYEHKITSLNK